MSAAATGVAATGTISRERSLTCQQIDLIRSLACAPSPGPPSLDSPLCLDAVSRVLAGSPAERVLDRTLREHRSLSREQRQALKEVTFNVGLWRRRLGYLLGRPDASVPLLLYAFLHGLAGLPQAEAASLAGVEAPPALVTQEPPSLALRASLPDWLADHFAREWGPEAEDFCAHLNVPGPISLRVNTLRTSREELAQRLRSEGVETRPGSWSPLALQVEGARPNLYGLPSLQQGLFEVQDEGSQLLGLLVEAQPGETVLDLCAGAGGKTLLLGAAMRNQGRLLAYDSDAERLDRLLQRCSRAGLSHVMCSALRPRVCRWTVSSWMLRAPSWAPSAAGRTSASSRLPPSSRSSFPSSTNCSPARRTWSARAAGSSTPPAP